MWASGNNKSALINGKLLNCLGVFIENRPIEFESTTVRHYKLYPI